MANKKKYGVDAVNSFAARLQEAQQLQQIGDQDDKVEEVITQKVEKPVKPVYVSEANNPSTEIEEEHDGGEDGALESKPADVPSVKTMTQKREEVSEIVSEETLGKRRILVVPPPKKETRSDNLMIRIRPSLKARAEALCRAQQVTISEAVNQLFEQWISDNE